MILRPYKHWWLSTFAIAATLLQGPVAAAPSEDRTVNQQSGQCRKPEPLPQIGVEAFQGQQPPPPVRGGPDHVTVGKDGRVLAAPPPPPPPPAVGLADGAISASASEVTSVSRRESKRIASPMPSPPLPYPPRPIPQAGQLTAGEHDDLLNPELYVDYVRRSNVGQIIPDLPQLDTARVLTVEVRDYAGNPVRQAVVEVACQDGNRLQLSTLSDGTVAFFPGIDRLSPEVRIRALGQEWRTVGIPRGTGGQRVTFTSNAIAALPPPKLDLVLTIDTTGSMGDEIRYLQAELGAIVDSLRARHRSLDLRVGFVFYRDTGDDYVTATVPLSRDIQAAQAELRQRNAGGGGDYPEAMDRALIRATRLDWRPDAVKTMLLVADAPPHDDRFGTAWLAAEHLRAARVHIVPVAASGVGEKAEYAMRAMAAATQSRYAFLTDDSGIGNPHAAPAIDCYLVTRLDSLLRRVIDSQLSGRRIEPDAQEVLRSVGQYDRGRCVIPANFGERR